MASQICTNTRLAAYNKAFYNDTPGPASYGVEKTRITVLSTHQEPPRSSVPKAKRSAIVFGSDTPGPADHQDLDAMTTLAHHLADSRLRDVPTFAFSTTTRSGSIFGLGDSPGPANYSPRAGVDKRQAPRSIFGTSTRKPIITVTDGPGPADYSIASPGFGAQATSDKITSTRVAIGREARGRKTSQAAAPGPGAYRSEQLDTLSGRAVAGNRPRTATTVIGRAKRADLNGGAPITPGPAHANISISPLVGVPRGGSMGRTGRMGKEDMVGEGAAKYYSVLPSDTLTRPCSARQPMPRAPRVTMGGGKVGANTPGPADYVKVERLDSPRSPGWTLRGR